MSESYKPLPGADFRESFLMNVEMLEWPNDLRFVVWSPNDQACYRITAKCVLEFHFMRTGTGRLDVGEVGIPLANIYITHEDEWEYWQEKIDAFAQQGYGTKREPICLEFNSHLFANRKRQDRRNRNTGLLVACLDVHVEEDRSYSGSRPTSHKIPGAEPDR